MKPATFFTEDHAASMTLRDYFAAAALTGLVSRQPHDYYHAAETAYAFADAMMAARGVK